MQGDIHEIWSLDMINQGDSALLNKDTLDTAFDWADNGRDILQFVLSYLPEASSLDVPTVQLSPVPPSSKKARLSFEDASLSHWSNTPQGSTAGTGNQKPGYKRGIGGWTTEDADLASTAAPKAGSSRSAASSSSIKPAALQQQPLPTDMSDLLQLDASAHSSSHSRAARTQPASRRRWRGRRIALIGHSVGAAGMIFTASTFPQLFESIVLVDPTIFPTSYPRWSATVPLVNGAIIRRTQWASREEAKTLFAKNKGFYGRWDKDILEGYVQYGLTEDEQGVTLKVDRMQEAVCLYASHGELDLIVSPCTVRLRRCGELWLEAGLPSTRLLAGNTQCALHPSRRRDVYGARGHHLGFPRDCQARNAHPHSRRCASYRAREAARAGKRDCRVSERARNAERRSESQAVMLDAATRSLDSVHLLSVLSTCSKDLFCCPTVACGLCHEVGRPGYHAAVAGRQAAGALDADLLHW